MFAGPGAARHLADFGADVVKIEAPAGDGVRRMGWFPPEGGDSYTWKLLGRNKRAIVADLKSGAGRDALLALADRADVLVENFRPGTLERLGLGPDVLAARNPRLVVLRVTGFGQDGPYASRPGFATMAEAMSGFAAINGEPDGPPLLPPIALTDEVAAIAGAFAVMVALRDRDRTGLGQVIDVNLLESMLQMMSALPSAAAHLGYEQPRLGSGIPYSVPRGTYRCADDRWVAISTSAESVAQRVLALLGLDDDARFASFESRAEHRDELDAAVTAWVGRRPSAEVLAAFEAAEAAIAPVYTMREVLADPHVRARDVFVEVDGIVMQGPVARLSRIAGRDALGRPCARRRHRRSPRRARQSLSRPTDRRLADASQRHRPRPIPSPDSLKRFVERFVATPHTLARAHPRERFVERFVVTGFGVRCRTRSVAFASSVASPPDQCFPRTQICRLGAHMPAVRYPTRYRDRSARPRRIRRVPRRVRTPSSQRATELDAAQQALAVELAEVRTKLAEMRVVMWPRVDPKDIVHGFRRTLRGGPPPIPPESHRTRMPVRRRKLRSAVLRCWRATTRPMTLVEIHREIASERVRDRVAPPGATTRGLPRATRSPKAAPSASSGASTGSVYSIRPSVGASKIDITPAATPRVTRDQFDGSGASSTRSRPRDRASSSARLAWCTSSAAPNACVG